MGIKHSLMILKEHLTYTGHTYQKLKWLFNDEATTCDYDLTFTWQELSNFDSCQPVTTVKSNDNSKPKHTQNRTMAIILDTKMVPDKHYILHYTDITY